MGNFRVPKRNVHKVLEHRNAENCPLCYAALRVADPSSSVLKEV